jgi:hypothetical protein
MLAIQIDVFPNFKRSFSQYENWSRIALPLNPGGLQRDTAPPFSVTLNVKFDIN